MFGTMLFLVGVSGCDPVKDESPVPIQNSPPGAPGVSIVPQHPVPGGEDAQCTVTVPSLDSESDPVDYQVSWTRNGSPVEGAGDAVYEGDLLSMEGMEIGDFLECVVTPHDGTIEGVSGKASAWVRARFVGWEDVDIDVDDADYIFEAEGIGTQAGRIFLPAGDVDGDGLGDMLVNAHKNESVGFFSGKVFLLLGSSLEEPGVYPLSEADYGFEGEASEDFAGHSVDSAGDIDGDGLADFVTSGYLHDGDGWQRGKVYVQFGGDLPDPTHRSLSESSITIQGEDEGDRLGHGVCGAGDLDGDGLNDIASGSYGNDHYGPRAGKGYVFLGSGLQSGQFLQAGDADHIFYGHQVGGRSGYACSGVGDVDNDGLSDMLMSARFEHTDEHEAGRTYLVLGGELGAPGSRPMTSMSFAVEGEGEGDICCDISELGDLDGDGGADLLVGSHYNDTMQRDGGAVYVVLSSTVAKGGTLPLSDADYPLYGVFGGDETGHGISGAGDVDGDGVIDLLVGAPGYTPGGSSPVPGAGRIYLVSGGDLLGSPGYTLDDAKHTFSGNRELDFVGWGAWGGADSDINMDGVPDLFLGSASEDPDGVGRAFLFLTPSDAPL